MGQRRLAVVLATQGEGKAYRVAEVGDLEAFDRAKARLQNLLLELEGYFTLGDFALNTLPDEPINVADKRNFWVGEYGPTTWGQLFNPRQALALVTFAKWVREAHAEMLRQGMDEELAKAVATYLAIVHDRLADKNASLAHWDNTRENPENVFARQALPMVWGYAEINALVANGWPNALEWVWLAVRGCRKSVVSLKGDP